MRKLRKTLALLLCAVLLLSLVPAPHAHAHAAPQSIDEYPEIDLDTHYLIDITTGGQEYYFRFTPTVTEGYCFSSISDLDTAGAIYDSELNQVAYDDSSAYTDGNFYASCDLEAGETYILFTQLFSDYQTGRYTVRLSLSHSYEGVVTQEPTCTEEGVMTYTCRYCGHVTTKAIPTAHKYVDGFCCWCGLEYLISGTYNSTVSWKLDFWGTLTISGTGDTGDWDSYKTPWHPYQYDITSVVVEEGITRLGHYALYYLPNVTSVTLPSSLRTIGSATFQSMGAAELVIPEGVVQIGNMAFNDMENLTSITLPSTLQTLGTLTFYDCAALKEVVFPDNIIDMGSSTFVNCDNLERVVLPKKISTIPASMFSGISTMTEVILPEALVTIEDSVFTHCWRLKNLKLPDTLTYIGKSAFYDCDGFTEIIFPAALKELGELACAYIRKLEKVVFLGDAPTIGENAFQNTTSDVWYPAGNDTWTEDVRQNYGGTLTWHALCQTHSFGPWTAISGSCTEPGVEQRSCTVCAWPEYRDQEQAPGHSYSAVITDPTCTAGGYTTYTCSRCADSYIADETAAAGHDYEAVVTPPTCAAEGYTTHTCSRCGDSYTTDPTERTEHAYGPWSEAEGGSCDSSGERHRTCTACGYTERESVPAPGHDWVVIEEEPATCVTSGHVLYQCSVCAVTYRETLFGTGHQYEDVVTPPTCTGPGYTTHTCTVCGFYFSDSYTEALGHDHVTTVVEVTCTESGYTKTTCTRCGYEKITDQTAPIGHNWADGVCTRCGEHDPDYIPQPVVNPFTDVKEDAFYYEAVLWAVDKGITSGVTDTTFAPKNNCTRGQVVTFLWRAVGCPEPTQTEHPFTDVKEGAFYYKAMLWAVEKGITSGTTRTTFEPNSTCTRGQVVTFLWRAKGKPEPVSTEHSFTDVEEGKFYYNAMLWAVENNITSGTTRTTFAPNNTCTRGQVVTFLYRTYAE